MLLADSVVSLGWIDLTILSASLIAVIAIGLRMHAKTKDLESYLLGDRNLPWWAILGSIVATETSTATVLSVPGHGYGPVGMRFLQLAFGYIIGRTIVVKLLLPLYFSGKLFTAYQVLENRFGTKSKQAASLLFLITRNLGDGLRLYLAAIVLQQLADWPFSVSVITMGLVTIFYTYYGGMRSVVWNDCLQFVIYMVGAIAAIFVITANIDGGWDTVWSFGQANDKFSIVKWSFALSDPYNIWAGVIGGCVLTLGTHGTDHMMVQRYLSAKNQRQAGLAVFLSGLVVLVQFAIFLFIGIQLAAYYSQHPTITFAKPDQVFAHFIVNVFPKNTGLIGLMLAAILAAAMSTLSSSLNSSASALVNDFYLPKLKKPLTPEKELKITQRLTIAFGFLQIGIGYWASQLNDTVVDNALTIAGFAAGLLLGVYALGVLTKSVDERSVLIGAAVGLVMLVIVQFGNTLAPYISSDLKMPKIAWPWLPLIGASTTALTGLCISRLTTRAPEKPA